MKWLEANKRIFFFFQFKLILAVSTACLFLKPGQMRRATAEELFPQGSEAGRKWQHQHIMNSSHQECIYDRLWSNHETKWIEYKKNLFWKRSGSQDSWVIQQSRKCFKFPTTLRKLFEVAVLSKISKALWF